MSRYSDRFMKGEEWESFLEKVDSGTAPEDLREEYGLSKRNMIRSVRRAQKQLGIEYTVPPEESGNNSARRAAASELDDPNISPVRRIVLAADWSWLTPLEKAHRLMPGRIGQLQTGCYTLDGRPVNYRDILIRCNEILAEEALEQLPGPNVFVPPKAARERAYSAGTRAA